jgi:hypothetical protein
MLQKKYKHKNGVWGDLKLKFHGSSAEMAKNWEPNW